MSGHLLAGIDIGGTKLGVCVGTDEGRVLARKSTPMDHGRDPRDILREASEAIARLAAKAAPGSKVAAVGAACPGPLDYAKGAFIDPPNMPRWHHFGIREWLRGSFACPSAMMNDANATALAEWLWGAARGAATAVYLTMSTGMGAGLIIDGRLYEGPLGLAGEIGHLRLCGSDDGPVGFGRRGSVEGYLSGPGMVQLADSEALRCLQIGEKTMLSAPITTESLCIAARAGDAAAIRVVDRIGHELGRLLATLTDILNPEVFVLGTIGTAYPDLFIPRAERTLRAEAIAASVAIARVVASTLEHRGDQSALAVARGAMQV
jgi:glucokinase